MKRTENKCFSVVFQNEWQHFFLKIENYVIQVLFLTLFGLCDSGKRDKQSGDKRIEGMH